MTVGRWLLCVAASLSILLGWGGSHPVMAADYALGCDAQSIEMNETVHPGQTFVLPSFKLYNKGTVPATYEMTVVPDGETNALDASWVEFTPRTFSLDPQMAGEVIVRIRIPSGAEPGMYRALLAGRLLTPTAGNVQMRIGIGPMFMMEVSRGSWLSTGVYTVAAFFTGHAPWSYFTIIAALLMVAAGLMVVRRMRSAARANDA